MEIRRHDPHTFDIAGLYLYTSNLEKFRGKSDADGIKAILTILPDS